MGHILGCVAKQLAGHFYRLQRWTVAPLHALRRQTNHLRHVCGVCRAVKFMCCSQPERLRFKLEPQDITHHLPGGRVCRPAQGMSFAAAS